jgi:creatinine amidohydrolase/Fe(II)-dependent formamide hydrolase-like protein
MWDLIAGCIAVLRAWPYIKPKNLFPRLCREVRPLVPSSDNCRFYAGTDMLNSRHFTVLVCLYLGGLGLMAHAQGQSGVGSVYVEQLTTQEVSAALKAGKTTVIIPVGGTEQNGPHMAIGKHNTRARVLAGRIAAALGTALVAPVLAYTPEGNIDPPTEHMGFAGTISIPDDVFRAVLLGAARSFKKHGFTDIVLLGDSGNYQKLLAAVAVQFNREATKGASPVRLYFVADYYRATQAPYIAALKAKGLSAAEIGTHAGSADTSLLMAVDASMVRPERFAEAAAAGWREGTLGDPRAASAANGQLGVDMAVKISVEAIKKAIAAPR